MTTPEGAPRPALSPPLKRSAYRPLSWRNPWTMMLGALAAFQAGVITTLLWTSGSSDKPTSTTEPSLAPAAAPAPATPPAAPTAVEPSAAPEPAAASKPPTTQTATPAASPRRRPPREPAAVEPSAAPEPREPAAVEPSAAPEPAAPGGLVEVEVRSDPEGATVKIAGAVWGVTPLTALLPARTVELELELDGHAPARLRWSPNQKRTLRAALTPLETP